MDTPSSESPLKRYTIRCTNMPEPLLNKLVAKQHFGRFGQVTSMYLRPSQLSCTIDYADSESAEDAIEFAGDFEGTEFDVAWAPKSEDKKKKSSRIIDPDWYPDPEVQAELEAMGAVAPPAPRLPRQQAMAVDFTNTTKPARRAKHASASVDKRQSKSLKNVINRDVESKSVLVSTASYEELKVIISKPAFTSEERYRVLDARDKLIRMRSVRQSDLASAKSTKGVCPDMCPEKERLMREYQHQVAQYELDPENRGVMNHYAAVKQYSRSSADQEVPLPHELRPVPVLERTMSYLLQTIGDSCDNSEVNLAEWFHFLWDRTRGIRKDITQQELCCQGSVRLVEQCARFHIHCSARLVSEDPSVFSNRINTENLTKCLQSLKYMYHDLAIKSEACPNEAEFRGYIILLNLQDGNFMWEVQQLKPDIQSSPEIKFAIQVYSALDSNNYIQFFKLVRKTTYLNACILLRYFNQVRSRALNTIVMTYTFRHATQFPLKELKDILAFEDVQTCAQFVDHYGLTYNASMTHVYIDKKKFIRPDIVFPQDRAFSIVESKRLCSVGETIYGGTYEDIDFYKQIPHNSFDKSGILKSTAYTAADQNFYTRVEIVEEFEEEYDSGDLETDDVTDGTLQTKSASLTTSNIFGSIDDAVPNQKSGESTANIFATQIFTRTVDAAKKFDLPKTNIFAMNTLPKTVENIFGKQFTETTESPNIFTKSAVKTNIFNMQNQSTAQNIFGKFKAVPEASFKLPPALGGTTNIFKQTEVKPKLDVSKPTNTSFVSLTSNTNKNIFQAPKPFTTFNQAATVEESELLKEYENRKECERKKQEGIQKQEEKVKFELEQRNMEAKRQISLEMERKQRVEDLTKQAQLLFDEILQETSSEICTQILNSECKTLDELKKYSFELAKEIIDDEVLHTCTELVESERQIQGSLHEIKYRIVMRNVYKCFLIWKHNTEVAIYKRKVIEETPVWIPERTVSEEALELYTANQKEAMENILSYKLGYVDRFHLHKNIIQRINVPDTIYNNITNCRLDSQKLENIIYWKLFVSIPDKNEATFMSNYLNQWLSNVFAKNEGTNNELYCDMYKNPRYVQALAVSVCKGIGTQNTESDGLNALLFFAINTKSSMNNMKTRLLSILKSKNFIKRIPLAIILIKKYNDFHPTELSNLLNIKQLVHDEYISEHTIILAEDDSEDTLTSRTKAALEWLASKKQTIPPLEIDELVNYVDTCLGSEFLFRLQESCKLNFVLRKSFTDPNFIINLYNIAVHKCIELLTNEDLIRHPDLAPELKKFVPEKLTSPVTFEYFPVGWKGSAYLTQVVDIIASLKIPPLKRSTNDLDALESDIKRYCMHVLTCNYEKVAVKMYNIVLNEIDLDGELVEQLQDMSWLDILKVLIINSINMKLNDVFSKIKEEDVYVIYNTEDLNIYRNTPWWLDTNIFQEKNIADSENLHMIELLPELNPFKRQRLSLDLSFTQSDFDDSIAKGIACLEKLEKENKKPKYKAEFIDKFSDLNLSFEQHVRKVKQLNGTLKRALDNT